MENMIIDQVDIDKFNDACKLLNDCIETIRYYVPSAHIYVTPNQINLMVGYGDSINSETRKDSTEQVVEFNSVTALDCGDW